VVDLDRLDGLHEIVWDTSVSDITLWCMYLCIHVV
jgi:hypothetical protein